MEHQQVLSEGKDRGQTENQSAKPLSCHIQLAVKPFEESQTTSSSPLALLSLPQGVEAASSLGSLTPA